ncbi:MAG: class I SAM-dependent methyltransferase [Bacteroidetes bacterium]|nr:class I SAM-dependent methyltransferase [Bacteroidota bacterium]
MSAHRLAGKQEFFDGVVPQWILDTEERTERLMHIFSRFALPCDAPVLDVGGGAGILLPLLHEQAGKTADIVELEVSMEMLRMGRQLHANLPGIHWLCADGHHLPFPSRHFGSIHCFSVFPHFDHPDQALAEFHRCLRPGGSLCILHLMGHEELNALHRDAGHIVADDVLPPVETLSRTLEDAGFTVHCREERSDLYLISAVV